MGVGGGARAKHCPKSEVLGVFINVCCYFFGMKPKETTVLQIGLQPSTVMIWLCYFQRLQPATARVWMA